MDRASATEVAVSDSIPSQVKPKTIKIGIHRIIASLHYFSYNCEIALPSHICFLYRLVFHQHLNSHIAYPGSQLEPQHLHSHITIAINSYINHQHLNSHIAYLYPMFIIKFRKRTALSFLIFFVETAVNASGLF